MENLKAEYLKGVYSLLKEIKSDSDEIFHAIRNDPEARGKLFFKVSNWSHWYSLPFVNLCAFAANLSGLTEPLIEAFKDEDLLKARLSFLDKISGHKLEFEKPEESWSEEQTVQLFVQVLFAIHYSLSAIGQRNRSLNCMVDELKSGCEKPEEVIFEAVSIDPSIIANADVALHISRWTLEGNAEYFDRLSRTIKGTYPAKRAQYANDLRIMAQVAEDLEDELTVKTMYEMNQLLNLIVEGEDPYEAIRKHLQTRKKDTRRSKRESSS
ncbi:hypothetical protein [Pseudidiomarina sp. CB1]|uniref:hypothetical protein n=1 Tax=Pseudidiomarina sp. CB1 TaxID=2972484 RepID=UPI002161B455|nr:hypothetical protein [Pseudidiomarina sp. CB1]